MRCLRAIKSLRAREGSDLQAIAIYTDVDWDAPYVRHADLAVRLPAPRGDGAAWLDHDLLIDALRRAAADAVWPGWGFVAEDPAFAARLADEGIVFLGPSAEAMRALGDKVLAKELGELAGVPVIPWSGGVLETFEQARDAAERVGYPLVVKAAAGGGGRGIRLVAKAEDLEEAFGSAESEARTAFGDPRLFLEKRVDGGRHIEVQIAADRHGVVKSLGCRDCSVQRRHQKVLEEAPPPGLDPAVREQLEDAARRLAARVGYVGLGTVEFLVNASGHHLLEMNPRLQVEHGITEAVTGLDLVELQIRIARGDSIESVVPRESGHAIEARVCAEDPDQAFLPAPGRVVRFDPALGPRVRVDTGVAVGSTVPPAFDSLVAKVIATGEDREEARARLAAALLDFDLVIEGGATNKGWLGALLDHADIRQGAVDVAWLDRVDPVQGDPERAVLALVTAAILRYQRGRQAARLNLFSDPSVLGRERIPASDGQEIDLAYQGSQVRLRVLAVGSWRYRVHLEGRVMTACLREEGRHAARLEVGGRVHRVLHDVGEAGLRVEIEGRPFRFGFQSAGQVRAGAPALVVGIHVEVGDRVRAGERLGLLEAMKVEVGFDAPVDGTVVELRVRRGHQVAAGDVILVIDPEGAAAAESASSPPLAFPEEVDRLAPLFRAEGDEPLAVPDLERADAAGPDARRAALEAAREEVRRVLLGYDAYLPRAERLAQLLEAPLPDGLSDAFRWELADLRQELLLFADVATLFLRWPQGSVSGAAGPSNHARLLMYVRRMRAAGAGIDDAFLTLVQQALRHYGVASLEPDDGLERAVLRMLASQSRPELRDRLVLALLRRIAALARAGVHLADDELLADALGRIASLRGLVAHAVADGAVEARYVIFERPRIERQAERTSKEVQAWLDAAESAPTAPPEEVLRQLADAPRGVFERVGRFLDDPDPRRRAIALAAHGRRLYAPVLPQNQASLREGEHWIERLELPGPRIVLAGAGPRERVGEIAQLLARAAERERASHEWPAVHALELLVPDDAEETEGQDAADALATEVCAALGEGLPCTRFTLTEVAREGADRHHTFVPGPEGYVVDETLHGVHPAAAQRIGLARLEEFELERLPAPSEIYCFAARSREVPSDERIVVLAEVRGRSPEDGREARLHVPAFEHVFHEATRSLRIHLGLRDPKRRLQWNRLVVDVAPELFLDRSLVQALSSRLAPATRNLGLEKVLVRLRLLDRDEPGNEAREAEIVISDVTGQNMTLDWRAPREAPLRPASEYERRVADARRRRLVYPYEIVRMLTEAPEGAVLTGAGLPPGVFEEYDLDPDAEVPRARSVAGRAYGRNAAAVVFGLVRTPTDLVPEGMERVLVLSDPTAGMGSLAGPECDRIVAALELAESRGVPLEWVPVSSGARIALDSGTENLDATARVVRRIVEFTARGGTIHAIVAGVNVGAQSYFDALATMLMHTRGALIMTDGGSMVLTGRAALAASGSVSADDEEAIGGFERVMGPNGQAQYRARDLADAFRILYQHYEYSYVVPGEEGPRPRASADPADRSVTDRPMPESSGYANVGEIFDDESNPGRKRPFPMRAVMEAVTDTDGGHLERFGSLVGGETAIVWDTRVGGRAVCLIGIESQPVSRQGYRPLDGPPTWMGGTLFPNASKKVARAIRSASGNRPVVVLANLSGFDGSPESMRKLQLEYGAEIARAVVEFDGPILFMVVSRYHGGAYVVFSRELNPGLRAAALRGSYASVIGGSAAATVVFGREVRARAAADPRVRALREAQRMRPEGSDRENHERVLAEVTLAKQAEMAEEFDRIHSVERAREVGSLEEIVEPEALRSWVVERLAD